MCVISLGAHDLELRLANKGAKSLPGDGETEYNCFILHMLCCSVRGQCSEQGAKRKHHSNMEGVTNSNSSHDLTLFSIKQSNWAD